MSLCHTWWWWWGWTGGWRWIQGWRKRWRWGKREGEEKGWRLTMSLCCVTLLLSSPHPPSAAHKYAATKSRGTRYWLIITNMRRPTWTPYNAHLQCENHTRPVCRIIVVTNRVVQPVWQCVCPMCGSMCGAPPACGSGVRTEQPNIPLPAIAKFEQRPPMHCNDPCHQYQHHFTVHTSWHFNSDKLSFLIVFPIYIF